MNQISTSDLVANAQNQFAQIYAESAKQSTPPNSAVAEATFNPELAKTFKLNPYLFQPPALTNSLASFDTAGLDAKFKEAQELLQSANPSDQIKGTQKMMEFERLFSLIIKMLEASQRAIMKAIEAIPTR